LLSHIAIIHIVLGIFSNVTLSLRPSLSTL
jgi:hypothetical protein